MEIKTDRITLLREFLVTQMNHWSLFPIYLTIAVMIADICGTGEPHVLLWLAVGIFPFLLYLGRRYIRNFWLLAALHMAVLLLLFLFPVETIGIRIFHIIMGIGYVVNSILIWAKTEHLQDLKCYPPIAVCLSLVMLFFQHYQGHEEWDSWYIITLVVVIGLYYPLYYIEQYLHFLTVNNSSASHIPAREMFHSGMGLVLVYTVLGVFVSFLVSHIHWLKGILQLLRKGLSYLLGLLFSLLPQSTVQVTETAEEILEAAEEMPEMEPVQTFWFWNMLEYMIEFLFLAVLTVVLCAAVIRLVKFIADRLKGRFGLQEGSTEAIEEIREKCDITRRKERKKKLSFLRLDAGERIRLLFKKRLLASEKLLLEDNKPGGLNGLTARESEEILAREGLAALYEKARYSDRECTGEDVKAMREICR